MIILASEATLTGVSFQAASFIEVTRWQHLRIVNFISSLSEKTDADVAEIAYAIGSDRRIGLNFLNASVGFGGSCFRKDILNLVYIAGSYGLSEVADFWRMVLEINEYQQERFVANIIRTLFNTVVGKKIAIFGFAFKANTGDSRESPAKFIVKKLLEEKAIISISDPQALQNAEMDLAGIEGDITFEGDPYRAADGASAIVLVTEWDVFKTLNYEAIYQGMKKPALIFDGRNILEHKKLFSLGFNVFPIGKPGLTHFN